MTQTKIVSDWGLDNPQYNSLSPLHREVVADFFKQYELEDGNIVDKVDSAIDKVASFHNVSTQVVHDYFEKEMGETKWQQ